MYLKHYGVPGMRWGFRKSPERAYARTIRQLDKYAARAEKGREAASARARLRQARLMKKAAKFQRKSVKVRQANNRLLFKMSDAKAGKKTLKYDKKAAKYATKAANAQKRIAKGDKAYERNVKKGQKMYAELKKLSSNVSLSKVNKNDINRGKELAAKYGWTSEYNRKRKK